MCQPAGQGGGRRSVRWVRNRETRAPNRTPADYTRPSGAPGGPGRWGSRHYDPAVTESRLRRISGVTGRVLLAALIALVLAGGVLVILGYVSNELAVSLLGLANAIFIGGLAFANTNTNEVQ